MKKITEIATRIESKEIVTTAKMQDRLTLFICLDNIVAHVGADDETFRKTILREVYKLKIQGVICTIEKLESIIQAKNDYDLMKECNLTADDETKKLAKKYSKTTEERLNNEYVRLNQLCNHYKAFVQNNTGKFTNYPNDSLEWRVVDLVARYETNMNVVECDTVVEAIRNYITDNKALMGGDNSQATSVSVKGIVEAFGSLLKDYKKDKIIQVKKSEARLFANTCMYRKDKGVFSVSVSNDKAMRKAVAWFIIAKMQNANITKVEGLN